MSHPHPVQSSADPQGRGERARWTSSSAIVAYLAASVFLIHVLLARRYGFHVDELYFLACSDHLSFGYIDQPPLIAVLAKIARTVVGESLTGLRILPAASAALLVWVASGIARELGGRRFAQLAAALAVAVAPAYLLTHNALLIVAFDPLVWSACIYFIVRAVREDRTRDWLLAGAMVGLGMELKYSIAFLLVGLLVGFVSTQSRRVLASWKLWAALGLMLAIAAPNLIWEVVHHFPFLTWQRYIRTHPGIHTFDASLIDFARAQVMFLLPDMILVVAALWYFAASKESRPFRYLGVAVLVTLVICSRLGKPHYAIPIYATVLAVGATGLERWTEPETYSRWRVVSVAAMLIVGALLAPCFLPLLPADKFAAYQASLHLPLPVRAEDYEYEQPMPGFFAWEFGWNEMVAASAEMYNTLTPEEKKKAGIITASYGQAGAIDLLGKKYGLPKAVCGQLSYHDFGSRGYTGEVLITIGGSPQMIASKCESVAPGPFLDNPHGYWVMRGQIVNVCRGLKQNLTENWAKQKHY